jgi:dTDP-4-dehydrorhamnose 3,5-epimerase
MRTYDINIFRDSELERNWVQENHSRSGRKNIIRGLHLQLPPYSETKLIRCIRGAVLDVFVDLRKNSPTFGEWDSVELNEESKKMIFIPRGFAHGYCTLTEESEVLYKVDNFYTPQAECGLLWNDNDIGIDWPFRNPKLSEKDMNNITLKKFIQQHKFIEVE